MADPMAASSSNPIPAPTVNTPLLSSPRGIITDPPYNRGLLTPPRNDTSPARDRDHPAHAGSSTSSTSCVPNVLRLLLAPWRDLFAYCCGCCCWGDSPQSSGNSSRRGHRSPTTSNEPLSAFAYLRSILCPCFPAPLPPPSPRRRRRRPVYDITTSDSDSTFTEYIPSRALSPSPQIPGTGILSPGFSDAYSPYSPLIPFSPDGGGYGSQQDYFTGMHHHPHYHQRYFRDVEAELRPGFNSHFLPGSYTRTNTQPTTPGAGTVEGSGTQRRITFVTTPPLGDDGTGEAGPAGGLRRSGSRGGSYRSRSGTGSTGSGLVAYGHGYDAVRQRMIYRQILALEEQDARLGTTEREQGYEGDYEDAGMTTTASNSGWASESVSGRNSPYEERRRAPGPTSAPIQGGDRMGIARSRWWAIPTLGGRNRGQVQEEVGGNDDGRNGYEGLDQLDGVKGDRDSEERQTPVLEREAWVGTPEGSFGVGSASRQLLGSNDNTPRPGMGLIGGGGASGRNGTGTAGES